MDEISESLLAALYGSSNELDKELIQEREIVIEPLILNISDPPERFINHLLYTVINQRRDVKNVIIPIQMTLVLAGISPDMIIENIEKTRDVITAVLIAYGHDLKYSDQDYIELKEDEFNEAKQGSRSSGYVDNAVYLFERFNSWENVKKYFLELREKSLNDNKDLKALDSNLKYISTKSLRFFLRDIRPVVSDHRNIPIPIDTNVIQAIQKTGLLFDKWPPDPTKSIPVKDREKHQQEIEKRVKLICKLLKRKVESSFKLNELIVAFAEALFLLGAVYCQLCPVNAKKNPKILEKCPFKGKCMMARHIENPEILDLINRL
ncbi:MAG: hypothetical protein ACTSRU_17985 [Candidatus Hodarchaeales archaeon]